MSKARAGIQLQGAQLDAFMKHFRNLEALPADAPPARDQVVALVEAFLRRGFVPQDWRQIGVPLHVQHLTHKWMAERGFTVGFIRSAAGAEVELTEAAQTDPRAWDEACRQAALWVERGELVPVYLRDFIGKVLLGEIKRPKGGERKPIGEDYRICLAVHCLVERAGYNATANEAGENQHATACGFVADVLGRSYNTVASIWGKRHKFRLNLARFDGPLP